MKDNSTLNYLKVKLTALQGLASGGDKAAAKELNRRGVALVSPDDVTKATYLQLRAMVRAWRDGASEVARADSFHRAQCAQDELVARWRTRSRLGWRKEDADVFGPPDIDSLPMAPWLIPPAPRCISWKRPTGSTHYPSPESIEGARLSEFARTYYKNAAGAPQK